MVHNFCAVYKNIGIRPLYENDIENVRQWRNNRALTRYLSPMNEITPEAQKKWYKNYCVDKNCLFFSITDQEKQIGTVAIYDFSNKAAEVGKIIIGVDSERGKGIGYVSLLMAMCVGIVHLGIETYKLYVCKENVTAYNIYKKLGFHETGKSLSNCNLIEIIMEITKTELKENNNMFENITLYTVEETK